MSQNSVAVFIDILGFADLVEADGSLGGLRPRSRFRLRNPPLQPLTLSAEAKLVAERFHNFHRVVQREIRSCHDEASDVTSLIFSDSAFVVLPQNALAYSFAVNTMRRMLRADVPVRMGIGHGSFETLRFFTDTSDAVNSHGCQFLGQAVVRSVRAESCGLAGCRIFLHPTIIQPAHQYGFGTVPTPEPGSKCPVSWELNYSYLSSESIDPNIDPELFAAEYYDLDLIKHLGRLRRQAPADKQFQYDETLAAFNRMRDIRGRPPLTFDAARHVRS